MSRGKPLHEILTPQEAIQCGLGQTGRRRCPWLDGTNICLAANLVRQGRRHGNAVKPPRDASGSLCPQGIGSSKTKRHHL